VLTGKINKDFRLDSVTVEPSELEISGPKAIIGMEEFINSDPIDISGLQKTTVKESSLDLKPYIADLIGEPVVAVRLNIVGIKSERRISGIPVQFKPINGKPSEVIYQLKPSTVSISAELPVIIIKQTSDLKGLFLAKVKPAPLKAGSFELKVSVAGPAGVRILSVSPETITLKIDETKKLKVKNN